MAFCLMNIKELKNLSAVHIYAQYDNIFLRKNITVMCTMPPAVETLTDILITLNISFGVDFR